MKYVKFRTWIILVTVVLAVFFLLMYSGGERGTYKSAQPITDSVLTQTYPNIYEAISERDGSLLQPYLTHSNDEVRGQAWRAFANTSVDSLGPFINLAVRQNTAVSWFGISQHEMNKEQLRRLEQRWKENPNERPGISRVLGQQGDQKSLQLFLQYSDSTNFESKYHLALAVGRLVAQFDLTADQQLKVVQRAFNANEDKTTRAYLYGWYRGDASRLNPVVQDTLMSRWQVLGRGLSPEIEQYINKMMPKRTTSELAIFYNGEQRLDSEVQLSIELAKSIGEVKLTDQNSLAAKMLLTNANTHVQVQTLKSLNGKLDRNDGLYNYITGTMLTNAQLADPVWLQALATSVNIDSVLADKYTDRLGSIPQENKYFTPKVLAVYEKAKGPDAYLNKIEELVGSDTLKTMYALQSMNRYWQKLSGQEQAEPHIKQVRSIVFDALEMGDRGVAYMTQPLLENKQLFSNGDFDQINNVLSYFSLPADVEVYQVFGSLYYDRFREQARPVIDSLAAQNYAPLNRSLSDAGWDVEVPETVEPNFRMPNWDRLWELGRHPVWTLKTEKGNISIEMNTLSAPATVSMIDSLSRAGAYDGVPFHRVVPNFVIQGGDIERKDGFGGPEFVIPTEASAQGFVRGATGIASAGTDTEGSQYFVMHQWKPHLNGSYTRFGKVVDGMDVVDNITIGDKVLSTTWY
ncbi:Peptidyl-prolyl cis-trans isomerase (rotamase) - cyclophilin family [Fodinibius salinus]|uniref:peptidylprolyl isomerase n=1 Tax=Fodinibius salinus TaxID=860790 RepID=A0A5D3YLR3_9BACT|nr:peptidylprolyl isomerase [Fodinibius salinus]TYP94777.1 Peptidyl-prolyl cis-trans isomerase (rotamase) - cyclophilin family [Fodinibius salinus]